MEKRKVLKISVGKDPAYSERTNFHSFCAVQKTLQEVLALFYNLLLEPKYNQELTEKIH